jgi:hypothetical protein
MSRSASTRQGELFQFQVAPEFQLLRRRGLRHILARHLFQDDLKSLQG